MNKKGFLNIAIAIIVLGVIAVGGVYFVVRKESSEQIPPPVQNNFISFINANPKLKTYFANIEYLNPEFDINKITFLGSGSIAPYYENEPRVSEGKQNDPYWIFSDDKKYAFSPFFCYGEDCVNLVSYNRNNSGRVETLLFCGTPCGGIKYTWLNNSEFMYIWSAWDETKDWVFYIYNLEKDTATSYVYRGVPEPIKLPALDVDEMEIRFRACEKAFGVGYEFCQKIKLNDTQNTMTIKVALVGDSSADTYPERFKKVGEHLGNGIYLVERRVLKSSMPLNAAMKELFALGESIIDEITGVRFSSLIGTYSGLPSYNSKVKFDYATIENGMAKLYFSGEINYDPCELECPLIPLQIQETAKQFSTVKGVETYANGKLYNWSSYGSQR